MVSSISSKHVFYLHTTEGPIIYPTGKHLFFMVGSPTRAHLFFSRQKPVEKSFSAWEESEDFDGFLFGCIVCSKAILPKLLGYLLVIYSSSNTTGIMISPSLRVVSMLSSFLEMAYDPDAEVEDWEKPVEKTCFFVVNQRMPKLWGPYSWCGSYGCLILTSKHIQVYI